MFDSSLIIPSESHFDNRKRQFNKMERSILWLKLRNTINAIHDEIYLGRLSQSEKEESIERLEQLMTTVTKKTYRRF